MALAVIVPPDPAWVEEFRAIGTALRDALGELAQRIDHIGSTAVPGLEAKNVIDVQVTVAALDLERLAPRFARAGFLPAADAWRTDHLPPGTAGDAAAWAKLFFSPAPGGRAAHVHVRAAGAPNQRYALLFRDYLRAHPAAAAAYGEAKRRLAGLGLQTGTYAEVKDPVCDLAMCAAEDWAARTGWRPGPSDA